ncbi:hypothetical protein [Serratia nevei]|uniref:hypothetical protein n=1 Tax=Serratia nevei TaxID=2703794 RepID=UPI003FA7A1F0
MTGKKLTLIELEDEFIKFINKANSEMHLSISKKTTDRWISIIENEINYNRSYKAQIIKYNNERVSGSFLYRHCILSAFKSIFMLFRYVRINKNLEAWCSLIDAYEYLDIANIYLTTYEIDNGAIGEITKKIDAIKYAIFPRDPIYTSIAMTETMGDCSICGDAFLNCEHVERKIYNGRLCQRVNRKIIEANHTAIVENPRDRRCIISTSHNDDGFQIDIFSKELIKGQIKPEPDKFQINLFHTRAFPLD